jgi:pimeloyl-ACP methyl ester carboxylesterase
MPHCGVVGARIHYEVNGEGEPLVLIAGTAFDLSFWQDLLPEPRGFRVLRVDNRGAGLSEAPDQALSIGCTAANVAGGYGRRGDAKRTRLWRVDGRDDRAGAGTSSTHTNWPALVSSIPKSRGGACSTTGSASGRTCMPARYAPCVRKHRRLHLG